MPIFAKKPISQQEKDRLILQGNEMQLKGEEQRKAKNLPSAQTYYESALKAFRQSGDPIAIGRVLQGLGMILRDQRQFGAAEKYLNEALELFRSIYDSYRQGTTLDRLATLHYMQNDGRAAALYRQAGDLLAEAGAHEEAILALAASASLETDAGNSTQAEGILRRSLDLAREKNVLKEEPHVLFLLGRVLVIQGRSDEAIPLFSRVLLLEEQMKEETYSGSAYSELEKLGAEVRTAESDLPAAQPQVGEALELFKRGQPQAAAARLQALLTEFESARRSSEAAAAAEALGSIQQKLGHTEEALHLYEKALTLQRQSGRQEAIGRLSMLIGMLQQQKEQFDL